MASSPPSSAMAPTTPLAFARPPAPAALPTAAAVGVSAASSPATPAPPVPTTLASPPQSSPMQPSSITDGAPVHTPPPAPSITNSTSVAGSDQSAVTAAVEHPHRHSQAVRRRTRRSPSSKAPPGPRQRGRRRHCRPRIRRPARLALVQSRASCSARGRRFDNEAILRGVARVRLYAPRPSVALQQESGQDTKDPQAGQVRQIAQELQEGQVDQVAGTSSSTVRRDGRVPSSALLGSRSSHYGAAARHRPTRHPPPSSSNGPRPAGPGPPRAHTPSHAAIAPPAPTQWSQESATPEQGPSIPTAPASSPGVMASAVVPATVFESPASVMPAALSASAQPTEAPTLPAPQLPSGPRAVAQAMPVARPLHSTSSATAPPMPLDDGDSDQEYEERLQAWASQQHATEARAPAPTAAPARAPEPFTWIPAAVPATPARAPEPFARLPAAAPAAQAASFNMADFLANFHGGAHATPSQQWYHSTPDCASATASTTSVSLGVAAPYTTTHSLLAEFAQFLLHREAAVAGLPAPTPSTHNAAETSPGAAHPWTLPDTKGRLPPAVCALRAADFPPPVLRVRGDFVPAAVYCLADARLYPFCLSQDGPHSTPMATVLRMRLLPSVKFSDAPGVLGPTYSARWGRYGITIMHYLRTNQNAQLRAGSSDANYSLDYSANVAPPPAPQCRNYHDLLDALQGLSSFASAEWYEPMTHPLKRLRLFVGANMDADPGHTPRRVQRTLDQVNHFLSSTFVHLASNSPVWWREFKAAARRIDFESASWALALQATAEPEAPSAGPAIPTALVAPLSAAQRVVMHDTSDAAGPSRTGRIPEHIRAIVPRNTEGQEPCLRFFAGSMCYGGSKTKCASSKRTHI